MDRFGHASAPVDKRFTVTDGDIRVSVITDRIIRVERDPERTFEERASQLAVCRDFAKPQFEHTISDDKITITTSLRKFIIDKKSLKVHCEIDGNVVSAKAKYNLGGTARTLDGTFGVTLKNYSGRIKKEAFFLANMKGGVMAKNGVSELDDSGSFLLNEDGSVSPRRKGVRDKYVFAFGDDYLGGLKEYYSLTGYTPLLPKYVLGNWWSRYYAYTERGYLDLMEKFELKNIPISVATIDMDWHIVKNVPKDIKRRYFQGRGWTGYTFEKSLFPDYKRFFKELKKKNLAVTMNLHPRDGVRYHEVQYPAMAEANGIDPATKQPVEFDLTDKTFRESYFDILHHPYEKCGVDFWWIDWQQGTKSAMKGLDPLWLLNHYHTMDINRATEEGAPRGVILSRYAGAGSHRYPLGFSGDTMVCWKSLKLQPWFTSTASNIGYTWWSHDIGGHMFGKGDGELYTRWVQYGVFSPILRLHSNNKAISKEPWLYGEYEGIATDFLRLRHRLLPYLYSMNVLTAKEGVPLCAPMYYYYKTKEAYKAADQYMFGTELMVAAVTKKAGADGVSRVEVYFPEGEWTDFFTGRTYAGGSVQTVLCPMDRYPVFMKKGAVVPMLTDGEHNSLDFADIVVKVDLNDNNFVMYDEDGEISVSVRRKGNVANIDIKAISSGGFDKIKLEFCNIKGADITVDGKGKGRGAHIDILPKSQKIRLSEIIDKG